MKPTEEVIAMPQATQIFVGTAGWSIPKDNADSFPAEGSHLERYAQRLTCAEINSSFYRPHKPQTYERWARSVPPNFKFAVKLPKSITHEKRLGSTHDVFARFLDEVAALGSKLGPLLVQLPPSLQFESAVVHNFLTDVRHCFNGEVVCEPRHATWFTPEAAQLLGDFRVGRVAADPAVVRAAREPGGWAGLIYYRLHGTPRIYYSNYSTDQLLDVTGKLISAGERAPTWCIFDNTAGFAATANALFVLGNFNAQAVKEKASPSIE